MSTPAFDAATINKINEIKDNAEAAYRKQEMLASMMVADAKPYYEAMNTYINQQRAANKDITFTQILATDGAKKIMADFRERTVGNTTTTFMIDDKTGILNPGFKMSKTCTSSSTHTQSSSRSSTKLRLF